MPFWCTVYDKQLSLNKETEIATFETAINYGIRLNYVLVS